MDWPALYHHLSNDPEDLQAWYALEARVRAWAGADLVTRSSAVRDDVVAETCASAVMSIGKARGPDTFGGFVKGWYLNARRRALRDLARQPLPLEDSATVIDSGSSNNDNALELLDRCFASLSAREQTAVRLRYFDEASSAEIARALGVGAGNARRIVFNGLAKLRECVRSFQAQEVA